MVLQVYNHGFLLYHVLKNKKKEQKSSTKNKCCTKKNNYSNLFTIIVFQYIQQLLNW
jgi:hypothetical protein